ncbi:efflux RND transporter periplasmic adaptor subunit [Taibaiella soli]|uniref:Efflux RND transporter periplasmic adaptor subunit n=1 Tax=Taibaiella soli TaxID=1649169 RepID=A0A2W2BZ25_9BACT|nr:efflux RND transporter periplasmic adaptor subunit [Taibaiella soli]PZF73093.1 efflux RND transporter periplasmic adaptor subunit [Taibaiella soli]
MKHSLYILITTLALASCGGGQTGEEKADAKLAKLKKQRSEIDIQIKELESKNPDTTRKATPVSITVVNPVDFTAYVEVQAQILSDENVAATSQTQGTIKSVLVRTGDKVKKGQLLATLDNALIDQQISGMEPNIQLLKSLYEKQQKLWAEDIGSEVQLLTAKANYEAIVKQKSALIAQKNMARIISPIDGVVDAVAIKEGDVISPMLGAIRIVNFNKLRAEATLGENYLGKVKTGDNVILEFPDLNDSLKTKLTYVAQAVDPISRAFVAQARLGYNAKLHPNMSCKMKIANYENSHAIVVPVSVIQKTANGDMLYVANGDKAKSVIVTTGRISNGQVEILSGLNAGDKIITEGFEETDNGEKIKIIE